MNWTFIYYVDIMLHFVSSATIFVFLVERGAKEGIKLLGLVANLLERMYKILIVSRLY